MLEIQYLGVSKAMLFLKAPGKEKDAFLLFQLWGLARNPWCPLACKHITLSQPPSSYGLLPSVPGSRFPSSFKDTSHWIRVHPNPV